MIRVSLTLLFGLMSLLPILAQDAAAAAQNTGLIDDTTYVSLTNGEKYTWTSDWSYQESASTQDANGEVIAISSNISSVLFSYYPKGLNISDARDKLLAAFANGADNFAQVDRGSYDNVSYSLDKANLSGNELGIFTLFVERTSDVFISLFIAPIGSFTTGLSSAQADIQIDGKAVFEGIQPAGLQSALEAAAGSSGTSKKTTTDAKTPEATKATAKRVTVAATEESSPTDEATREVTPKSKTTSTKKLPAATEEVTPKSKTTTNGNDATPSGSSSNGKKSSSNTGDYTDLGVVADGEYQSPQFGSSVTWDNTWVIDDSAKNPVLSNTADGTDQITFARADQSGAATYGSVSVRFFAASEGDTPASIVDYWTSDKYLTEGAGKGSTVLLSDSTRQEGGVVLVSKLNDGTQVIQYLSVFFLDRGKTAVVVEFYATPDSVETSLTNAQNGITVEGDPILTLFDPAAILKAL